MKHLLSTLLLNVQYCQVCFVYRCPSVEAQWGISKLQRSLPTAQVLLGENLQEEEELFKEMQTWCENLQASCIV